MEMQARQAAPAPYGLMLCDLLVSGVARCLQNKSAAGLGPVHVLCSRSTLTCRQDVTKEKEGMAFQNCGESRLRVASHQWGRVKDAFTVAWLTLKTPHCTVNDSSVIYHDACRTARNTESPAC